MILNLGAKVVARYFILFSVVLHDDEKFVSFIFHSLSLYEPSLSKALIFPNHIQFVDSLLIFVSP